MSAIATLCTPRLRLRPWRDEDLAPFAELNADPRVMEFFPKTLDRGESDAMVARIRDHCDLHGFGLWAVEVPGAADFIGFVGLAVPKFEAHFTPCVEIGWRLAREHWGRGYATEAARAALVFGFRDLALDEIVSFTTQANLRSRAVMERIGMARSPADDFDHPSLPEGHPLRRHVLYRARHPDGPGGKERTGDGTASASLAIPRGLSSPAPSPSPNRTSGRSSGAPSAIWRSWSARLEIRRIWGDYQIPEYGGGGIRHREVQGGTRPAPARKAAARRETDFVS